MFTSIAKNVGIEDEFLETASQRASAYERRFAAEAVDDPSGALVNGIPSNALLQAARLRGLIARATHAADSSSPEPSSARAQTQVSYDVATLTARPGDQTIDPAFFGPDGRLLSPDRISNADWSVYDTQLSVYLAKVPNVNDAIRGFGGTYQRIATAAGG